ncbi:hypothetical protein SH601_05245 [Gracilibacillus sp. S3-1-1]|uniref:Uncharacterized protein n=1 Tax=Gracilibacillus pellucidus TaxID=3095368 RepID=A0ACC6M354_9BACI|nr:hypothetical protein [Gracilibacillus sp. S3-1-1]MDX8045389.1 hypothetical protein [Gracilibacillus sp. S3-1-1]
MTLVCCTLTDEFSVISGDTHVSNENGTSRTDRKIFKYDDMLIGGAGSGGIITVIPQLLGNYQKETAERHMQAVANIFKSSGEKVIESKYSQLLYVSKDKFGPFLGVVDTRGDHQILRKGHKQPFIIWKGIGEPDVELLKSCCSPKLMKNLNIDTAKKIHEDYITKVSRQTISVNDKVIHEELSYK